MLALLIMDLLISLLLVVCMPVFKRGIMSGLAEMKGIGAIPTDTQPSKAQAKSHMDHSRVLYPQIPILSPICTPQRENRTFAIVFDNLNNVLYVTQLYPSAFTILRLFALQYLHFPFPEEKSRKKLT